MVRGTVAWQVFAASSVVSLSDICGGTRKTGLYFPELGNKKNVLRLGDIFFAETMKHTVYMTVVEQ